MGANGSGKSTLALLLAGLVSPDQGRIGIAADSKTMTVGLLFQNPDNQMVAVTVDKEIAFVLENLAVDPNEMEHLVRDTAERFSIEHLLRRLTSELSGGEKQRVALASVMISGPSILILDEPDSFLDEKGKMELDDALGRLQSENRSMVIIRITQYPAVAFRYRRLIVFEKGRIVADTDPATVFADREFCERTGLAFSFNKRGKLVLPTSGSGGGAAAVKRIEMRRVSFGYQKDSPIVRNLDFTLGPGEIVGLVGPSGAGKSSLGMLICGLLRPDSGETLFLGGNGHPLPPSDCLGQVSGSFQQPERQFFLPTASEEIRFGPDNLGRPVGGREVDSILAMVGLDPANFAERDPFTLSAGEKRRLAFAAVLSMTPRFIVFDEPTCGLDQEGVGRFVLLAEGLKEAGVGLVVISHDGSILQALADRVLYLNGSGSTSEFSHNEFFDEGKWQGVVSTPERIDRADS
jgi:energy-coupling factor transport system ATP-binding protein